MIPGELRGVPDRLLLLAEVQRVGDDDARGDPLDAQLPSGAGARQLLQPVDRQPLRVDVEGGPAPGGHFDGRRQREVRLPRGRRAVQLRDGAPFEPPAEQFVDGRTPRRYPVAHCGPVRRVRV